MDADARGRGMQLNCGPVDIDRMINHDDNPNQGFFFFLVGGGGRAGGRGRGRVKWGQGRGISQGGGKARKSYK